MKIITIFILTTVLYLLSLIIIYEVKKNKLNIMPHTKEIKDSLDINIIFAELVKQNVLFPEIVRSQILLETGHLKSNLAVNYKNLFGIKYVKNSLAKKKTNSGFAIYDSYSQCIKDYKRIQQLYLKNIQEKYSEDSLYIKKIKQIK